jgi:ankyrin repeat protein
VWASYKSHDGITKPLLDVGAQVYITKKKSLTVLMLVTQRGHDGVAKLLLLDGGAQVDTADRDGWAALIFASRRGHDAAIKLLRDHGAKR